MEYVVDTYKLRVRLAVDKRSMDAIASAAKLPVSTIEEVLATGKAEKDIIDKIRLSVKPQMYFSTICPSDMQVETKPEQKQKNQQVDALIKLCGDDIKRQLILEKKTRSSLPRILAD